MRQGLRYPRLRSLGESSSCGWFVCCLEKGEGWEVREISQALIGLKEKGGGWRGEVGDRSTFRWLLTKWGGWSVTECLIPKAFPVLLQPKKRCVYAALLVCSVHTGSQKKRGQARHPVTREEALLGRSKTYEKIKQKTKKQRRKNGVLTIPPSLKNSGGTKNK